MMPDAFDSWSRRRPGTVLGSWILAAVLVLLAPPGSAATEEKEYSPQVFLTLKEALDQTFPGAEKIDREKKWLTKEQQKRIGELAGQTIEDSRLTFYVGKKNGKPLGYLVVDHVIGKSFPITFMVVLNVDGTVRDVEVMVYREPRGWEVRFPSFLSQFFGKDAESDFRNIHSITGATLSVRAMTQGVRKAVAAYQVLYREAEK